MTVLETNDNKTYGPVTGSTGLANLGVMAHVELHEKNSLETIFLHIPYFMLLKDMQFRKKKFINKSIEAQTKAQVYDSLEAFVIHVTRVSRFIYMLLCALMNGTVGCHCSSLSFT